ncbi:MAG: UDP-glucose 4-epimerase GalE [Pseudomonadota bacterium]
MDIKKVLVTGGAGYIGSHACKELAKQGYKVVVFDNLVYGHEAFVKWSEFEKGDLLDSERINNVIKKHKPDAVMHFAAYAYVGESVTDPAKYYENNVVGTFNLLNACKNNNIKYFVFSSTCATYGMPNTIPIPEDHTQNPINPYGQTKLTVEKMLADFDVAYGLKSAALRYFNAAGADPESEIGEDHNPETHLIPLVLDAASGKRASITIFGDDYNTEDGTCIRDYIHVTDLADAHVKALEYIKKENKSCHFNLGNGLGYSVKEVIEAAKKVTGKEINIVQGARRPGDPDILVGSSEKAKSLLSWKPQYFEIETILEHAWKWHISRKS